eukprot:scaffold704_cov347-Prasinococcus_capsulatus_cf.AAC.12
MGSSFARVAEWKQSKQGLYLKSGRLLLALMYLSGDILSSSLFPQLVGGRGRQQMYLSPSGDGSRSGCRPGHSGFHCYINPYSPLQPGAQSLDRVLVPPSPGAPSPTPQRSAMSSNLQLQLALAIGLCGVDELTKRAKLAVALGHTLRLPRHALLQRLLRRRLSGALLLKHVRGSATLALGARNRI